MDDHTYVVGHTRPDSDSICSAIAFAAFKREEGVDATPLVQGQPNAETEFLLDYFDVELPEERQSVPEGNVILVDHSEVDQAPNDLSPDQIRGIVDHHRIGDIESSRPAFYFADTVGCTATLIHELAADRDIDLPADVQGLMLGAILSDTMLLASPTCTDRDEKAARALADVVDVDIDEFGRKQFKAKSTVGDLPADEALRGDLKVYDSGKGEVAIGQMEVADGEAILADREAYVEAMEALKNEGGYHGVVLLVTDIPQKGTYVLVVSGEVDAYEDALETDLSVDDGFVSGLLSRKRQVVPPLLESFETA